MLHFRKRATNRLIAAFSTLALAVTGLGLGLSQAPAAQAEDAVATSTPNPAIVVSDVHTQAWNVGGTPPNCGQSGKVFLYWKLCITWKWDARNANPKEGDSFFLGLPTQFQLLDVAPYDLMAPVADLAAGTTTDMKVGTCTSVARTATDPARITCTFDKGLTNAQKLGNINLVGDGWLAAYVREKLDSTTADFNLNGTATPVPNPGGEPIAPGVGTYRPRVPVKENDGIRSTTKEINWKVVFGSGKLAEVYGGAIPTPLVLTDTLSDGQLFSEQRPVVLDIVNSPAIPVPPATIRVGSSDTSKARLLNEAGHTTFTIERELSADRKTMTLKISPNAPGTWEPDTNYVIRYSSVPDTENGLVDQSRTYSNKATFKDTNTTVTSKATYSVAAGGTARMEPGYGTFSINKIADGTAANTVPANTKVKVKVKWALPGGKSAADFPGWTAPASNPFEIEVLVGGTATYFPNPLPFPAGTQIELTEDLAGSDLPTIRWDNPRFKIGAATDTTANGVFTVDGGAVTNVNLTNAAEHKKVSVGDYVWFDTNKDGLQDDGEPGIEGVTLTIARSDNASVTALDGGAYQTTTKTDASGKYAFTDLPALPAGVHYVVSVTAPAGHMATTANAGDTARDSSTGSAESTDLTTDGASDPTLDFGFIKGKVSVGDYVWFDTNADGIQDDDEKGIEGVTLTISRTDSQPVKDAEGNPVSTTTTDAAGKYQFTNLEVLPQGVKYVVTVTDPAGHTPTTPNAGDPAKDSSTGSAEAKELPGDGDQDLTLDFGYVKGKVSVGDYVWVDSDKNGTQDAGEPGIEGVALTISRTDSQPVMDVQGNTLTTTKTDADGKYLFKDLEILPAGVTYVVTVTDPEGYVPTTPNVGDPATDSSAGKAQAKELPSNGDSDLTLDFGYVKAKVTIGDYVWEDTNRNGTQDAGEPGIKDVTLTVGRTDGKPVMDVNGNPATTTTTGADGKYLFENLEVLPKGVKYVVTVTAPDGFTPTTPNVGDPAKDSSTDSATSKDLTKDGDEDLTLDFGFVRPRVSVGDYVWFDANKDGVQDATDQPLEGVTLTISRSDSAPVKNADGTDRTTLTTVTDATGMYSFTNLQVLPAGTHYVVTVTAPAGFAPTAAGAGGDTAKDSSTGSAESTDLTADGANDPTLDFGFVKPAVAVGDFVWEDTNKNGTQDAGEPGIKDVTLTVGRTDGKPVTNVSGATVTTTTTDADGKYVFDGLEVLPDGVKYVVTVTAPSGYQPTTPNVGDPATDSSTDSAISAALTKDGDKDLTLDFGFVKSPQSNVPPAPNQPPAPKQPAPKEPKLPVTGSPTSVVAGAAVLALLAGGAAMALRRRRG